MRSHKFSKKTLDFLVKAGKQKSPSWLEKNMEEYEKVLRGPFIELAELVKKDLQPFARDYHFPSKGLARIKRPDFKVAGGQSQYKDWISMMASRPSKSRFESNPHLSKHALFAKPSIKTQSHSINSSLISSFRRASRRAFIWRMLHRELRGDFLKIMKTSLGLN